MLKVNFPKTKTPVIRRICNLIQTKGDILNPQERKYAQELTDAIRENIIPWENIENNTSILKSIQAEFEQKVQTEHSKKAKAIIKNVENYVFKDAQYHYEIMSNPVIKEKLTDIYPISAKIIENAMKRNECFYSIEKILGCSLTGSESWQEIEQMLKNKQISCKQREICKNWYNKGVKYNSKRVEKVIQRENQIAANEQAAKQYGFWKSYDYVYNMPKPQK